MSVRFNSIDVDGLKVFYREAGNRACPTVLLLHGFPSASHMFRDLIPQLADRYHVVAPDLPGFGMTEQPARDTFAYTFENFAHVIGRFTEVLGLDRFAVYVFDYGAPVGFRLAVKHPERITAIVTQNGNTYLEGVSKGRSAAGRGRPSSPRPRRTARNAAGADAGLRLRLTRSRNRAGRRSTPCCNHVSRALSSSATRRSGPRPQAASRA